MELNELTQEELTTYAFVRSRVLFQLLKEIGKYDSVVKNDFQNHFAIAFAAMNGPQIQLSDRDGELAVTENGALPHVMLWFPKPENMSKMLVQQKTFMLPVPYSFRIGKTLKTFKKGIERLQWYTDPKNYSEEHAIFITKLLLHATAYGIKEVAEHDSYVQSRVTKIADGYIEIYVRGVDELAVWLEKKGDTFTVTPGRCPHPTKARLIFEKQETAYGMFSGQLPALMALADEDVKIRGNFPMIQNLFPILNRLGVFMAIKK